MFRAGRNDRARRANDREFENPGRFCGDGTPQGVAEKFLHKTHRLQAVV